MSDSLDLVLERRGSQKYAVIWMPADGTEAREKDEFYTGHRGRASYTYFYSPSLGRGQPAIRMHVRREEDLEAAMQRVLKKANGAARHSLVQPTVLLPAKPRVRASTPKPKPRDVFLEGTAGEDETTPFELPLDRRRVITVKKDLTVDTVVGWITRRQLDVQPEFQRRYVWPANKASRLIESLLLNIPVPTHYTAENPNFRQVVVDGQQRITSVHAFVTGKFPDGREFRLSGLQVLQELNGKSFADLSEDWQNKLLACGLGLTVITADSDPEVRYEVFARINMGAEKLADQELRNAVYRGSYNTMLKTLAATPLILKVMGLRRPHRYCNRARRGAE